MPNYSGAARGAGRSLAATLRQDPTWLDDMRALAEQLIEAAQDHRICVSDIRLSPLHREPVSANSWGSLFRDQRFVRVSGVRLSEIAERNAGVNQIWTLRKYERKSNIVSVDFRQLAEDTISVLRRHDYRDEEVKVNLEILVAWITEWLHEQRRAQWQKPSAPEASGDLIRVAPAESQPAETRNARNALAMAKLLGGAGSVVRVELVLNKH